MNKEMKTRSSDPQELIQMDETIPILQKIFPNIASISIITSGMKLLYPLGNEKLDWDIKRLNMLLDLDFLKI